MWFDGRSRTANFVRAAAGELAAGLHADGPSVIPQARFIGRGLTAVNLVTLTLLYADALGLDPTRPQLEPLALAAVLATCGVAAGLLLSLDVGRRLRPGARVWPTPEPPLLALLGIGLLAVLSGLIATASLAWAQERGSGFMATTAGLILFLAALAGPMAVVATEVYGTGLDGRRLARAERVLTRWSRRALRRERRARRHLDAAERSVWRAEAALAALSDVLGPDHRMLVGLTETVGCLRREWVAASRELDDVLAPIVPDELDLAG